MNNKIIVIGDGAVGSSYAFALVTQNIGHEISIIDVNRDKAEVDAIDLSDALAYTAPKRIYAATYVDVPYTDLVVITAGKAQKPGETRLDLVHRNMIIMKDIIELIKKTEFDGILLIASNPVDIMTYAAMKFSNLPHQRVIDSGTSLDSARFRQAIGHHIGVDPRNVYGYILGEHGDTEFPVWSHPNVGELSIFEWTKNHPSMDDEALHNLFFKVKDAAKIIIDKKGAAFYGIAAALARITKAIFNDEHSILPLSCYLQGEYGQSDIYLGVPAIINRNGIVSVIEMEINESEQNKMDLSAKTLRSIQEDALERITQ